MSFLEDFVAKHSQNTTAFFSKFLIGNSNKHSPLLIKQNVVIYQFMIMDTINQLICKVQ